jgi:hypothetical protein
MNGKKWGNEPGSNGTINRGRRWAKEVDLHTSTLRFPGASRVQRPRSGRCLRSKAVWPFLCPSASVSAPIVVTNTTCDADAGQSPLPEQPQFDETLFLKVLARPPPRGAPPC